MHISLLETSSRFLPFEISYFFQSYQFFSSEILVSPMSCLVFEIWHVWDKLQRFQLRTLKATRQLWSCESWQTHKVAFTHAVVQCIVLLLMAMLSKISIKVKSPHDLKHLCQRVLKKCQFLVPLQKFYGSTLRSPCQFWILERCNSSYGIAY